MARPQIDIDLAEVERLAGLGLTNDEIAYSLGIGVATLQRRKRDFESFDSAIKKGRAKAAVEVGNALFDRAKNGDVAAIIWYEKTRRGLSEKTFNIPIDWSQLTDEQLDSIERGEPIERVLSRKGKARAPETA